MPTVNRYMDPADHAGLGYPHRMVATVDAEGQPYSVTLRAGATPTELAQVECLAIEAGGVDPDSEWAKALSDMAWAEGGGR